MKNFAIVFLGVLCALVVYNVGITLYLNAKHDPEIERLEKAAAEAQAAHNIYQ